MRVPLWCCRVRGDDAQPGRFRNRTGTPGLKPQVWIGPAILSAIMLVVLFTPFSVLTIKVSTVRQSVLSSGYYAVRALRTGGGTGFYVLLAGLVVAFHVGREERAGEC